MQVAGSMPHLVIWVTGAVCCRYRHPLSTPCIFASFLGTVHHRQAGPEGYENQLKKKKIEPKRWLSKKLGDKPFAQSTEFCFMIMKGGQLNSKGKPHVRWKHFKSFFLPSHRTVKQNISGISGQHCPVCSTVTYTEDGAWGDPAAQRPVSSVTKVSKDSALVEKSKIASI